MQNIKDFFFLNLNNFENINIPFPIGMFLTLFTLVMCVMTFVVNYQKMTSAGLLKQLLRHKAFDEESAKTLKALKIKPTLALRHSLSQSGQLTYMVKRAGYIKPTYEEYVSKTKKRACKEERIDFGNAEFYLDLEKIDRAKRTVETSNTAWYRPIVLTALFIAVWVVLLFSLPPLLEYLNEVLGAK